LLPWSVYEWVKKLWWCSGYPSMTTNVDNMRVTWFCKTDEWPLVKLQIICKLVMVLPTKSFKTDLGFTNSVQEGSKNSSKMLHKQTCLDIYDIWIAMVMKVMLS
jgi:hypothetical protein